MPDSLVHLPVSVPHVKNKLLITNAQGSHCLFTTPEEQQEGEVMGARICLRLE